VHKPNRYGGLITRELIKAVKAISDENRLRMLRLLMEKECCVREVMQALETSHSLVPHATSVSLRMQALLNQGERVSGWFILSRCMRQRNAMPA